MNNIKILGSDFDGTLCRDGEITQRDAEAIADFQKAGNLFVLVTSRNFGEYLGVKKYGEVTYDYVSCCCGACLFDRNEELVADCSIGTEILGELCGLILKNDPLYLWRAYRKRAIIATVGGYEDHRQYADGKPETNWKTEEEFVSFDLPFNQLSCAFGTEEHAAAVCDEINRCFGDTVSAYAFYQTVDVVPAGCGKAFGLRKLAELYGVPEENISAVGDGCNDLPMITAFNGYTVENGHPRVKAAAKKVFPDIASLIEFIETETEKDGE